MHLYQFSPEDISSLEQLFSTQEDNLDLVDIFRFYLSEDQASLPSSILRETNPRLLLNEYAGFLLETYLPTASDEFLRHVLLPNISLVSLEEYTQNPYLLLLKDKTISFKSWALKQDKIDPLNGFIFGDNTAKEPYFSQNPHFGISQIAYSYPAIYQNGREWMSLKPNEIETMKAPLENAHGRVLIYGLGLGYFAFMASNKMEVSAIDIVEIDQDVIDLFTQEILPLFPHKEKIHLIHDDAVLFSSSLIDGVYDYTFIDLWHDVSDGLLPFISFRQEFVSFHKTQIDYWIMESMVTYFRMLVIGLIRDEYQEYYLEDDYTSLQKAIKRSLANLSLYSYSDILFLLSRENILSLITSLTL